MRFVLLLGVPFLLRVILCTLYYRNGSVSPGIWAVPSRSIFGEVFSVECLSIYPMVLFIGFFYRAKFSFYHWYKFYFHTPNCEYFNIVVFGF